MAKLTIFMFASLLGIVIANPLFILNESKMKTRIFGGITPSDGQFSYLVSIQNSNNSHICVGSILNENWIISVASCFLGVTTDDVVVVIGSSDLSDTETGVKHKINKFISHSEFDVKGRNGNDIALINTKEKIIFSRNVQPIKLPQIDYNIPQFPIIVPGWGPPGKKPRKLQYIQGSIFDHESCINLMAAIKGFPSVKDKQICILTERGQGFESHAAGAPTVTHDDVLIGLTSMRSPHNCLFINTRVWKYRDWINGIIIENNKTNVINTTSETNTTNETITTIKENTTNENSTTKKNNTTNQNVSAHKPNATTKISSSIQLIIVFTIFIFYHGY